MTFNQKMDCIVEMFDADIKNAVSKFETPELSLIESENGWALHTVCSDGTEYMAGLEIFEFDCLTVRLFVRQNNRLVKCIEKEYKTITDMARFFEFYLKSELKTFLKETGFAV